MDFKAAPTIICMQMSCSHSSDIFLPLQRSQQELYHLALARVRSAFERFWQAQAVKLG